MNLYFTMDFTFLFFKKLFKDQNWRTEIQDKLYLYPIHQALNIKITHVKLILFNLSCLAKKLFKLPTYTLFNTNL